MNKKKLLCTKWLLQWYWQRHIANEISYIDQCQTLHWRHTNISSRYIYLKDIFPKPLKYQAKKIEADIILALVLPTIVTPPFSLFSSQVEDPMPEIHGTWLEWCEEASEAIEASVRLKSLCQLGWRSCLLASNVWWCLPLPDFSLKKRCSV